MVAHHNVVSSPNEQTQALLGRKHGQCPWTGGNQTHGCFLEGSNLISALESDGPITGPWQVLYLSSGGQPVLYSSRDVGWLPTLPS